MEILIILFAIGAYFAITRYNNIYLKVIKPIDEPAIGKQFVFACLIYGAMISLAAVMYKLMHLPIQVYILTYIALLTFGFTVALATFHTITHTTNNSANKTIFVILACCISMGIGMSGAIVLSQTIPFTEQVSTEDNNLNDIYGIPVE